MVYVQLKCLSVGTHTICSQKLLFSSFPQKCFNFRKILIVMPIFMPCFFYLSFWFSVLKARISSAAFFSSSQEESFSAFFFGFSNSDGGSSFIWLSMSSSVKRFITNIPTLKKKRRPFARYICHIYPTLYSLLTLL